MTYLMNSKLKVTVTFGVNFNLFMSLKGQGSFEVAITYFMTPKVTVTFVVGLTYFITPKKYGVIRGRHDLFYNVKYKRIYALSL